MRLDYLSGNSEKAVLGQRNAIMHMEAAMTSYTLPVVIEKDADGYFAQCLSLQGSYTQGEAIETPEMVSITNLEIAA